MSSEKYIETFRSEEYKKFKILQRYYLNLPSKEWDFMPEGAGLIGCLFYVFLFILFVNLILGLTLFSTGALLLAFSYIRFLISKKPSYFQKTKKYKYFKTLEDIYLPFEIEVQRQISDFLYRKRGKVEEKLKNENLDSLEYLKAEKEYIENFNLIKIARNYFFVLGGYEFCEFAENVIKYGI